MGRKPCTDGSLFLEKKMGITDIIAVTRRGRGCYNCYVVAISV